jgi:hypothetical protein
MRASVRDAVRERFAHRCGYCGVSEEEQGARLTIDHFQPVSHGGTDDEANLVYACHACNEFKSDVWESDPERRLLHPERDDWALHLVESLRYLLVPLTERGRVSITVLRLNRPALVARRRQIHREAERQEILTELLRRFEALEAEISLLRQRLQ